MWAKHKQTGFTIVELLIVIVVIGILAAISIVAYNGIQNRAVVASLSSDLDNANKLLRLDQVSGSAFPSTLALANSGRGIPASSGTTYSYSVSNTTSPQTFCLTATNGTQIYNITQEGGLSSGICPILNLDAGINSSYSGIGTTWTDLSGSGNNGTLLNGVTFVNSNSGSLNFNGINSYVAVASTAALNFSTNGNFTISVWINPATIASSWRRGIIMQESYLTSGYRFGINGSGAPMFWTDQSGGTLSFSSSQTLVANQWAQVVATYNNQQAYIYVNGIQKGSSTGTYIAGSSNVCIGCNVSEPYSGLLSNVRFYSRALTASEVQQSFNDLRGRYGL